MALTVLTEGTNFLLLFTTLLLTLLFFILKNFNLPSPLKAKKLPPGPYPWPVIGNILHMGKKPHITLTRFAQSYGPLISLRLGTQMLIVGSSPEAAMEILKTHDHVLSARHVPHVVPAKRPELNHLSIGWTLECNDGWKKLRSISQMGLFSGKVLESQACLRQRMVKEMVAFLGTMEGKLINVGDAVFSTLFNIMSNILISKDLVSLEHEGVSGVMRGTVRAIMEVAAAPNLMDFYPILCGWDLQQLNKKSKDLAVRLISMWESAIKERRERKEGDVSREKDFLDVLLENDSQDVQINLLFLELIVAGTDTTFSTIEWTMTELIRNPETMMKLQEELATEITDQEVVKDSDMPRLPYLQACVKETLRLHPPGPFLLPHRAAETCKVMNYTIPKDSQVLVNIWAIGRDPAIWEEPLQYKPERFLNLDLSFKGNNFEYLPFGSGRRICPGLPMASKHIPLFLASLIHFFDWSLSHGNDPKDLDISERYGATLQKEKPLLLIPKFRK